MKTIQLECPKKVKKAIGLQSDSFEINQSSVILEKLKNYATQNKSRITFGLKIIDEQGEEEFKESFLFTSDSTTNLLVLLRQALYTDNYSETPATEKELFLSQVEKDFNQPLEVQETLAEPKIESQKGMISMAESQEKVAFWKGDPFKVMLLVDVIIASAFLWILNFHTLAILIPVVLMVGGSVFFALKKMGGQTEKKQAIIAQTEPSKQQEVVQQSQVTSQVQESQEEAFPSATEQTSPSTIDPFPHDTEPVEPQESQEYIHPQVAVTLSEVSPETAIQTAETFPKASESEVERIYEAPHTVKTNSETRSELKSAEENHKQNLEWLSQQIQGFKDKEMQIIIDKQRELEALHPETIEAMNEAKEKIDEIYQLQLAFEKKWKVA